MHPPRLPSSPRHRTAVRLVGCLALAFALGACSTITCGGEEMPREIWVCMQDPHRVWKSPRSVVPITKYRVHASMLHNHPGPATVLEVDLICIERDGSSFRVRYEWSGEGAVNDRGDWIRYER